MIKTPLVDARSANYCMVSTAIFYIIAIACYLLCSHNAYIFGFIEYFTSFFDGIVTLSRNAEITHAGGQYAKYIMFVSFMAPVFIVPLSVLSMSKNYYMLRVYDKTLIDALKALFFINTIFILGLLFWLFEDIGKPYGSGISLRYSNISITILWAYGYSVLTILTVRLNLGMFYHMVVLKNKEFLKDKPSKQVK